MNYLDSITTSADDGTKTSDWSVFDVNAGLIVILWESWKRDTTEKSAVELRSFHMSLTIPMFRVIIIRTTAGGITPSLKDLF